MIFGSCSMTSTCNMFIEVFVIYHANLTIRVISLRLWNLNNFLFSLHSFSLRPVQNSFSIISFFVHFLNCILLLKAINSLVEAHARIHSSRAFLNELMNIKLRVITIWNYLLFFFHFIFPHRRIDQRKIMIHLFFVFLQK